MANAASVSNAKCFSIVDFLTAYGISMFEKWQFSKALLHTNYKGLQTYMDKIHRRICTHALPHIFYEYCHDSVFILTTLREYI